MHTNTKHDALVENVLTEELAQRYAALPEDPSVTAYTAWNALGRYVRRQARSISDLIDVVTVAEAEPYVDAGAMFDDIRRNRRLLVSHANTVHPLWNVDDNVAFRTYHDFVGHYLGGWSFELRGEIEAYADCARHIMAHVPTQEAWLCVEALYCESIGQLAYLRHFGQFPSPQLCGVNLRGVL